MEKPKVDGNLPTIDKSIKNILKGESLSTLENVYLLNENFNQLLRTNSFYLYLFFKNLFS